MSVSFLSGWVPFKEKLIVPIPGSSLQAWSRSDIALEVLLLRMPFLRLFSGRWQKMCRSWVIETWVVLGWTELAFMAQAILGSGDKFSKDSVIWSFWLILPMRPLSITDFTSSHGALNI